MKLKGRLRALGFKGELIIYRMGWDGEKEGGILKAKKGPQRYSSDLSVIAKQCDAIQNNDIGGIIHLWNGPTVNPLMNDSMMRCFVACVERGMRFGIMLDKWVAGGPLSTPTSNVIAALQSMEFRLVRSSRAFIPYLLDFDLEHEAGVNMAEVKAAFPDLQFLSRKTGYSWPEPDKADPIATLKAQNAAPTMVIPGLCKGFDDAGCPVPYDANANTLVRWDMTLGRWSTEKNKVAPRVILPAGYFDAQLAITPMTVPFIALITLDDYEEGTQWETELARG